MTQITNPKGVLQNLVFEYGKKEAHLRLVNMGFTESELINDFELTKEEVDEAFALHAKRTQHRFSIR